MQISAPAATSSADADTRLLNALRSALVDRRQVVDIEDFKFRFQRFDEVFEDDGKRMLAMASGVYAKFPVTSGGKVIGGRWLHLGATDDLEVLMTPYLHPLTPQAREDLSVCLSASAALRSMVKDRTVTPGAPESAPTPARRPRP